MTRTILNLPSSLMSSRSSKWVLRLAGPILMLVGSPVMAVASVLWGG
jgi:hypothetical protein